MTKSAESFGGCRVGHWTDADARTGCTVVLPPRGNVCACDIRGSSPSSRELTLLHVNRRLTEVHGIVLTGGSAFGLAAADGVMSWLEEQGIGYQTPAGVVPIVPAAVVFDLGTGRADRRPGADEGRAACSAAATKNIPMGAVGAGTGATVGKWAGFEYASPGGLGIASVEEDGTVVHGLAVVNSVGDVIAADGRVVKGTTAPDPHYVQRLSAEQPLPTNTVLAVVLVPGTLDKMQTRWVAARGADGITRSVRPAHTRYDGDVVFALSLPPQSRGTGNVDVAGHLASEAVAAAVRAAVS